MLPSLDNLKLLKAAMCAVASEATAYGEYNPSVSPLDGHCGAAAYVLHRLFGGEVMSGTIDGERHLWNRLTNKVEVDMTKCQYGKDGFDSLVKGRPMKERKTVNEKHSLFFDLTIQKLKETS